MDRWMDGWMAWIGVAYSTASREALILVHMEAGDGHDEDDFFPSLLEILAGI
jgi:hypothetical protein